MHTSEEPVIYDIGYKTLGKFWSVKRMVYVTHGAIPQTMHARADMSRSLAIRQLIVCDMTFRSRPKHLFL